jgi:hypothetical protein
MTNELWWLGNCFYINKAHLIYNRREESKLANPCLLGEEAHVNTDTPSQTLILPVWLNINECFWLKPTYKPSGSFQR